MLPKHVETSKNVNPTIGKSVKWDVRIIDPKIIQYEFKPRGETETELRQCDGDAPGSASAIAEEDPVSKNEQSDKKVAGFVEKAGAPGKSSDQEPPGERSAESFGRGAANGEIYWKQGLMFRKKPRSGKRPVFPEWAHTASSAK